MPNGPEPLLRLQVGVPATTLALATDAALKGVSSFVPSICYQYSVYDLMLMI